jgi:DNA modification methylase
MIAPRNVVLRGDCRELMRGLPADSVDAVVTDPPYELGFMGKSWDSAGVSFDAATWAEALRVLKPGGHLLAFGGSRTYHRIAVAIEDAGFEIRDTMMWLYGSGFPKSHNLKDGWEGWGTALKPAHEPIVVARKPLIGTVVANVLGHGTGALNIGASRIGERWPANVLFDEEAATQLDASTPATPSRFFYVAKTSTKERNAGLDGFVEKRPDERTKTGMGTFDEKGIAKQRNHHPTVKPITLMRYLIRLVTPPGGVVLDPFLGSGSTACAAVLEGFDYLGMEMMPEYANIAEARIAYWTEQTKEDEDGTL